MVRINNNDPEDFAPMDDDLPSTRTLASTQSLFGGQFVERRPAMILIACSMVTALGFILGALLTLGILIGFIEVDPSTIKTVLRTILGKS